MRFSDSHHFRKMVAGCCMVVGPLFILISLVVGPDLRTDAGEQMAAIAADRDGTIASLLFSMAGVALMIGATLGVMHMLRERMVGYGHLGGAMALLGLVALAGQFGAWMLAWQMAADGVQATDVAAYDGLISSTAGVIALQVIGFAGIAGVIVLAAGLYRAHAVDWWMAACLAIGAVGIALAGPFESIALGVVASAVLCLGLGSIGLMVLRETDAEWESTPEYGGFRPALHMK